MKEDLQIKIAAGLADKHAPEKLSGRRASEFVSETLHKKRPVSYAVWGGSMLAIAASVVLAIFVFSPKASEEYGAPSQLMEMQSVHSDISQVDTTCVDTLETVLTIESVKE